MWFSRAAVPSCCLAILLTVPGGCIKAPVHSGRLTIDNRTTDVLVVRAQHADVEEILVQPCETFQRDDFPLASVSVSPQSTGSGAGIDVGVDAGDLLLLIVPDGGSRQVEEIPSPEPECAGHM